MKYVEKIKFFNFRRFASFEYEAREMRNVFIGDNEAGKSTILQAVDIVLSGSRSRVESLGLESLFHQGSVIEFLGGEKELANLPKLIIEIYLNDYGEIVLEGINNSDERVCHGLRLLCEPMDEYGEEIQAALAQEEPLFPYEYYSIQFSTFSGQSYTQNRRFLRHILIDSSIIGSEYATRQYTKSLYEANTDLIQRHQISHAYRHSKSGFVADSLAGLNADLGDVSFDIKNDSKSNLEQDLMITEGGIPVAQMGKGNQCFIKAEFALQQREDATPIDLVLIEEPENHLSHVNMKRLVSRIEEATETQLMIATHSNSVCSRLDLHNASLVSPSTNIPVSLSDLPDDTSNYFVKAPNNKILEFILSKRVILVEGDAEYMLIEGIYENSFKEKPENSNIHVISVGGTSFKRYLDLANLLEIRTAVIRDNDGNFQANCIDNYEEYTEDHTQIFYDEDDVNRSTFEKCIYQDNEALCEELFSPGRRTLTVQEYMLSNKANAALALLDEGLDRLNPPNYISQALEWIRA
jgi:energy-coupling factor transporter ATP-binding protein EcfA2